MKWSLGPKPCIFLCSEAFGCCIYYQFETIAITDTDPSRLFEIYGTTRGLITK